MATAEDVIVHLHLAPHPEGGWYRETWRAPASPGERSAGTAIFFLLKAGERSHWHRVDATELWVFQAGHPLMLSVADQVEVTSVWLGVDLVAGDQPQLVVQPRQWQAAQAVEGWALVTCLVVPSFEFAGFELAPPSWAPDDEVKSLDQR